MSSFKLSDFLGHLQFTLVKRIQHILLNFEITVAFL